MNLAVRLRLLALGTAVAVMGVAIALIILNFERQVRELQTRLNTVDAESGQIAAHFKDALREVTNTRLHYAIGHDPAVWAQFLNASRQLNLWLDEQALKLTTQSEKSALREVKSAYQAYLQVAGQVPAGPDDSLAAFTRVRSESQHLFDLGEALAASHNKSRNQLLAEASQRLRGLQRSLLILLSLLFVFGFALAAMAYRDMIAPLRVKLVESQELAERNEKLASLGMLAAGVAHEIRNPLTAIKAALFIQQKNFVPGSPEQADSDLIQREISRLERIVNDFLRFARPSDPHLTTIPADLLLEEVQIFFAPDLARAGIRLTLGAPTSHRIDVDAGQIKQVLINLVQNAVDSIGRDGLITLRARHDRKPLGGVEQDVVILEVADNGKGIPPEVRKRLFDPFFTTKEDGTGLGLSIAARIVEKHGGALQYQTQVNRGTTFGIVLPQNSLMSTATKVLLIEDDAGIADTVRRVLVEEGHDVVVKRRGDEGLAHAVNEPVNVVITDLRLPGLNGLELIRQLRAAQPRLPVILITAFGTTDTAIEATKYGAYDYLLKPFAIPQLIELVRKAADSNRLMSEPVVMGEPGAARDALVGRSEAMQAIYKEIGRAASKPVNVLIRGETGTGKELIARALYQHSERAQAPFIAVNCAAIPETLLESELFGHERGAFTGAEARRIGRFEQADHGTLFLDEIGDMTPSTQVKLIRVLQEKCVQRVGGKETIPVDVRVIAATHRDLEAAIREKQFREDLYYRLSVVVIALPPLRNRREDIPDLIRYFLHKHGASLGNAQPSIRPEAVELLQEQAWPGNVRHLENVVRKVLLLTQGYTINRDHVDAALSQAGAADLSPAGSFGAYVDELLAAARRGESVDAHARVLETAERELFSRAIQQAQGNQAKAARWLGVSRVTMKAKLVQFGLHPDQTP